MRWAAILLGIGGAVVGTLCARSIGGSTSTSIGPEMLKNAIDSLSVRETDANSGPWIDDALRAVGINPPANWCAAGLTRWMREACSTLGITCPIAGGASAKGVMNQLQTAGLWTDVAEVRDGKTSVLVPGAILVWHRGAPGAWTGHIGVVEAYDGADTIHTVEANSGQHGDGVYRMTRTLSDPLLLGVGNV